MLKSDSKNLERSLLIMLGGLAVVVVGVFFCNFFFKNQILSSDIAQQGQFGDYFGGTLNPIIGIFTAYFSFYAFKATKESLEISKRMQQASQLEIYLSSFFRIYDNKIGNLYVVDQGKIYRSAEALSMIIHKIDFYLSGETDWDSILSDVPNENNPFNFTRCLNYIRSVKMMLEPINLNIFDTNSKYIFSLIAREYMHQDLIGVILKLSDAEITKKFQDTEHNNSLVQIAKLRGILFIIK